LVDRSRSIAELGKDHVLFFFYRSDCPYCHAFAPTWRPSRRATASRSWPSASMAARCRVSPMRARTTALPPP
jgi:hypothetical protein